jgi:F-type H+-transporting ATPase subunit a|tara:strand:- start:7600 stop:8793 length:1194 start_codon:yes stop_codon:yes gene_type:complete
LGQETVGFSRFGEYLCSAILKSQILKNPIFFFLLFLSVSLTIQAKGDGPEIKSVELEGGSSKNESPYDPTEDIMHHISDSYGWHLFDWKGHSISVPLPIILFTEKGLVTFMSSSFHHDHEGKHVVETQGYRFVNYHEKIYYASSSPNNHGAFVNVSKKPHTIENKQPIDISITKNVASLLLSAILILWLFLSMARFYKKQDGHSSPKGVASFMEPIVVFVRDEIAKNNIGRHYNRFVPLLLTFFFFIWINNVLGLIPIFPGGANLTGNIAVTMVLALVVMVVTNLNGNKNYWSHIFWMPGVPVAVKPLLAVVEFIGIFTKPFSLMIRLFANITAGHIIVLSLISLIFIFETVLVSPVSVLLTLFISVLEILVTALQAYIFTLLTALYIGAALQEEHH